MSIAPLLAAVITLGTASAFQPSVSELAEAIQSHDGGDLPEIRNVRCAGIDGEPTEFACEFQRRGSDGQWSHWFANVAVDGGRWILIDDATPVEGRAD